MKLKERFAIITGASQGLGRAMALEFVRQGAGVMICARDKQELFKTKDELKRIAVKGQAVHAMVVDVSKEGQVQALIRGAVAKFKRIDILVNNAGVYGPKGPIETVKSLDWIKAVEINLFGVFYGCKHVMGHMKRNKYGKIINLSGGGATGPLPFISAYAASKAAIVRLTETLAAECQGFGIDINALAPGALNTRLLDEVLSSKPDQVGKDFYARALKQKKDGGVPLETGVELSVFLASSLSDGITGRLISAPWDPWQKLAQRRKELNGSDIYTLRRIVPEDRGRNWE